LPGQSLAPLNLLANACGVADEFERRNLERSPPCRERNSPRMNHRSCQLFMLIACICAVSHSLDAQTPEPGKQTPEPSKPKQFIYVLRLVPRLYDNKNWTKEDNAALDRHFTRFQEAAKSGQLILAGRTKEPGDKTFGIAIFRVSDEAAAKKFMESDPAVVAKLMTAELHPFYVAVQGKAP
jgi:uncharacterized protein